MIRELDTIRRYFERLSGESPVDGFANGYSVKTDPGISDEIYRHVSEEIRRLLNLQPSDRLLDIGCGSGALLERLAPQVASAKGLDISPGMVRRAQARGLDAAHYDGLEVPLPVAPYDKVLIFSVIINIPDLEVADRLLRNALQVLRPGGWLLVGNNPHPDRSQFPRHTRPPLRARLRQWIRTPPPQESISCFSYEYGFFTRIADSMNCRGITFRHASVPLRGWSEKYHVLFER